MIRRDDPSRPLGATSHDDRRCVRPRPAVRAARRRASRGSPGRPASSDVAVAVEPQPDHPARPAAALEQHLQLGRRPVRRRVRRRVPGRRPVARDEPPRGPQRGRDRLAPRPGADRVPAGRRRVAEIQDAFQHAYDPRVTWLEDRWYVTWCNGYHGPTIGIGYTHDFRTFHQLDNAFLPFNRNGVLFPAPDRRPVPDAQPAERQRPHAVRRHLPVGEPGPRPLGPASPRDVARAAGPGSPPRSARGRRRSRRARAGCCCTTAC